ncbi:MAG: GTP cyclohydrolase II [Deltaproteobacteria bacterium]|nr:GTP cyclohydrolase II [Deltaproteobacteria bacterium]
MSIATSPIDEILADLRLGKMVILVDEESDQGEADLCQIAELTTPDSINFVATHARGLVCLALTEEKIRELGVPLLGNGRPSANKRVFGASIEARRGVTTGISAYDRALTIRSAVKEGAGPEDLSLPGHIHPMVAHRGGVLARSGLAEGAVDLARLAGLKPAAVLCTILREDGGLARGEDVEQFARQHDLKIASLARLMTHRLRTESLVHRVSEGDITSPYGGKFHAIVYRTDVDKHEHLALVKGKLSTRDVVTVRVHSQCLTGDVFGSERCDCGEQLNKAMQLIADEGQGVIIYMHQEGRGIGLANKIRAYALQDQGLDTVEANLKLGFKEDLRDYGIAAQILRDLRVSRVRLLTNNPQKITGLEGYGIKVAERQPIETQPHAGNIHYLQAKKEKLGHLFTDLKPML